ncbi:MAG: vWA domain-containing protein [Pyrinomonadaceae bacterium]
MKRLTIKIVIALLTFTVGVGATAAWIDHSRPIDPTLVGPVPLPYPNAYQNPVSTNNRPTLEMVFVLDTTGSMSGLLEGAKQRIWGIVNDVMKSQTRPAVRIGLVAYRDIGDDYVTQLLPLTSDLDQVYTTLMAYRADGGGDTPENVRRALADGVRRSGWSQSSGNLAQIIFLVGDAPPHDDYVNEPSTTVVVAEAVKRGMIVNAIQCGNQAETTQSWQLIASRGEGQYFAIAQDGGVAGDNNSLRQSFDRVGKSFRRHLRSLRWRRSGSRNAHTSGCAPSLYGKPYLSRCPGRRFR